MTIKLFFRHGESGGTELNLMAGVSGFQLAGNGWAPNVADSIYFGEPPPILESMKLLLKSSSQDDIASDMQALHQMQVWAEGYIKDPHQEDPVWLHAKMDNETGERRVLIRNIIVKYKTSWFGSSATALDVPLVIAFIRQPYWESTSVRNLPDAALSAAACLVYDYTASGASVPAHDIVGDIGSRIRHFRIWSANVGLAKCWIGARSEAKHSGLVTFQEIWECEDGTNFTDATDTVDATASGGNRVTVSESAVNWDDGNFHPVLELLLVNVTASVKPNLGNFLWMLRARLTGATTWEIRLRFSYNRSGQEQDFGYIEKDIVEIDSALWNFYEMGIMAIGLRDMKAILFDDLTSLKEADFRVDIYARRTSGSGDLYLDCFCPIPIDEGFIKVNIDNVTLTNVALTFGISPIGTTEILAYSTALGKILGTTGVLNIENFVLPPGDGRMYIIYSQDNSHLITGTVTLNDADVGKYYERWLSLRGSE